MGESMILTDWQTFVCIVTFLIMTILLWTYILIILNDSPTTSDREKLLLVALTLALSVTFLMSFIFKWVIK